MAELTKEHLDKQFEKMAVMIKNGFNATATKDDLNRLETKVDIIQGKLDNILYKEIVGIETRVNKIEKHLGLKTISIKKSR
jgi:hypothetical protein